MTPTHIPPELDARILDWSNMRVSCREIAKRLEKEGVQASHTTVARRLRRIRGGEAPGRVETLVSQETSENVRRFEEAMRRLKQIEDMALNGDEARGVKPDLSLAHRTLVSRYQLMLNRHRLFGGSAS